MKQSDVQLPFQVARTFEQPPVTAQIPIREWNYITQDAAIRHVGPTAQDFHAAFGHPDGPASCRVH